MAKERLTNSQIEAEIKRLLNTEAVQLARKEININNKRRRYMYQLRSMEKRGQQLQNDGITLENIEEKLFLNASDESYE